MESKDFLDGLSEAAIRPSQDEHFRTKALSLILAWAMEFESVQHVYPRFGATYRELRSKGINFPPRTSQTPPAVLSIRPAPTASIPYHYVPTAVPAQYDRTPVPFALPVRIPVAGPVVGVPMPIPRPQLSPTEYSANITRHFKMVLELLQMFVDLVSASTPEGMMRNATIQNMLLSFNQAQIFLAYLSSLSTGTPN